MDFRLFGTDRLRRALLGLTLLAIMVAGLIPAGFMPDFQAMPSGRGAPALTICHGAGLLTIDPATGKPLPAKADHSCPYAPLLGHMAALKPILLPAQTFRAGGAVLFAIVTALRAQSKWLAPPARGPPSGL